MNYPGRGFPKKHFILKWLGKNLNDANAIYLFCFREVVSFLFMPVTFNCNMYMRSLMKASMCEEEGHKGDEFAVISPGRNCKSTPELNTPCYSGFSEDGLQD